jgi:hypothetical protein
LVAKAPAAAPAGRRARLPCRSPARAWPIQFRPPAPKATELNSAGKDLSRRGGEEARIEARR